MTTNHKHKESDTGFIHDVTLMQKSKKGRNYYNFTLQTSPTKYKRVVGFDHKSHQIAKHMQTTGSPTKIPGAREENVQLFINQGTTILEANSSDIDFPSQKPTAVTDWKSNDQASDITLDQIKSLTRNQRVNVKGVLTLGELPPKEVEKRNGEIGHVKEDCVIEDGKGTSTIHIWDDLIKHSRMAKATMLKTSASKITRVTHC